jgi:DNA repair photolyase
MKTTTQDQKPITSFVDGEVARGAWREQEIQPGISGLARPIYVFRAIRKQKLVTYDKHGDEKTFCPPVWYDLGIGSGACGLGCRSCFLMLTFRAMRDPLRHVLYENTGDFIHATEQWLKDPTRKRQHTLGLGIDRSDSLLYEGVTAHARNLAPLFADPAINRMGNKLVLLTKSANTHYLADIKPEHRGQVVVSFSLNPEPVADLWEGKWDDDVRITPTITRRLLAAKYAQELGFEVRVRVDPILTPPGWEALYASWISEVRAVGLDFRYWTLGTYRDSVEYDVPVPYRQSAVA